jgi:hypothetical protein
MARMKKADKERIAEELRQIHNKRMLENYHRFLIPIMKLAIDSGFAHAVQLKFDGEHPYYQITSRDHHYEVDMFFLTTDNLGLVDCLNYLVTCISMYMENEVNRHNGLLKKYDAVKNLTPQHALVLGLERLKADSDADSAHLEVRKVQLARMLDELPDLYGTNKGFDEAVAS